MFASLLMLLIMALLLVPGIVLGNGRWALSPRTLGRLFLLQSGFFIVLSLICKAFPWLIDPRISLF